MIQSYNYFLPKELIADCPASPRDASRLLVFDTGKNKIYHQHFFDLKKYLQSGDLIVTNNSRVMPARLIGKKISEGKIEVLLLEKAGRTWKVLVGGKISVGEKINFSKNLEAEILEKNGKECKVKFNLADKKFWREIERIGQMPIPPYIEKKLKTKKSKVKTSENYLRKNYQTVYAKNFGSAAAPTAGLHFTKKLMGDLRTFGIEFASIDLHVGLGTFAPIDDEDIKKKKLHSEKFSIPHSTLVKISAAKKAGHRIIAVGTTTVRALESSATEISAEKNISGQTDIFIQPGDKFRIVDGLITNFHLPKSSLMMLVAAFLQHKGTRDGREKLLELYHLAIENNYRFYSFGDAMLIV